VGHGISIVLMMQNSTKSYELSIIMAFNSNNNNMKANQPVNNYHNSTITILEVKSCA
jgi:hypothetical protein